MGILTHDKDIKELRKELKNQNRSLKKEVDRLEKLIEAKESDSEKEAKGSALMAARFKNRAQERKEEADEKYLEILAIAQSIADSQEQLKVIVQDSQITLDSIKQINSETNEIYTNINSKNETLDTKIESINNVLKEHPDLEHEIDSLEVALNNINETSAKINSIHKNAIGKKNEVYEAYIEIVGHEETDEESGDTIHINGLKDNLEGQYNTLKSQQENLTNSIKKLNTETSLDYDKLKTKTKQDYLDLIKEKNKATETVITDWKKKYESLEKQIQDLIPNALTAGLSYAFSEKKKEESALFDTLKIQFNRGIFGLVAVSTIPFILSLIFLVSGDAWDIVINRIPRLVLAILPVYFPVLWLAYSSGRKMNLSKRLIEEYSHKEVLSKTFEGLSTQINNLEDSDSSKELKTKLLYNFLEVSSENPGKLISNYNKSDHPFMEILDQSYKLDKAVEKLQKIPGLEKLTKIVNNRSKKIVKEGVKAIEEGFDTLDRLG